MPRRLLVLAAIVLVLGGGGLLQLRQPERPARPGVQMLPLAESRAFGVARPDAGRMECPAETLGEGKGGGRLAKAARLQPWKTHEHQGQTNQRPAGHRFRAAGQHVPQHPRGGGGTVDAAWQQGIRYFDTARLCGAGLSEMRLGRALAKLKRGEYVLSSKVGGLILDEVESGPRHLGEKRNLFEFGRPNRMVYDYSADGTLRSIEDSLKRIGIDRLDFVWIHDLSRDFPGDE